MSTPTTNPQATTPRAMQVERLCKWRVRGAVYLEVGLADDGIPFDHFLRCPTIPLPEVWDASTLAHKTRLELRPGTGELAPAGQSVPAIYDLVRWIGEESYPTVTCFIEEARYAGISLRLPGNFNFAHISKDSRLILIHPRAIDLQWRDHPALYACRKDRPGHEDHTVGPCLYQMRHLVPASLGEVCPDPHAEPGEMMRYRRHEASIDYYYHPIDHGHAKTTQEAQATLDSAMFAPGIFGVFSPTALTQIRNANGGINSQVQARMEQSDLPTFTDQY